MHICIQTYTHIHIYTHILYAMHVYIDIYICVGMCVCVCVSVCVCVCVCVCERERLRESCVFCAGLWFWPLVMTALVIRYTCSLLTSPPGFIYLFFVRVQYK
jgi:hypothetical protein